jgi:endonuclease/exonuclease/phosphatase family metal-dependent hydrolase
MHDMLRLMTLNVAHGARRPIPPTLLGRAAIERNLAAIASAIVRARVDVVALQEIDRASAYTGGVDHWSGLSRASDLAYGVHAPHGENERLGMRHGHALLSRRPLDNVDDRRFQTLFCHDKGWVVGTASTPELGGAPIDFVSVHLEPFSPRVRHAQIRELVAALGERRRASGRPLVVMGDMNTGHRGVRHLARGLGLTAFEGGSPTFPAGLPIARLDWVLVSRELRIVDQQTLPDAISDHAPVVAEIALA